MADTLRLLTDEHISLALVRALRDRGWDVVRVVEEPRLGQGTSDDVVFAFAVEEQRVVLSSDAHASWRPRGAIEASWPFPGMIVWTQRSRNRMSLGDAIAQLEALAREDEPFAGGIRHIKPVGTPAQARKKANSPRR